MHVRRPRLSHWLRPWAGLLLAALLAAGPAASQPAAGQPAPGFRPNVVLILAEDASADLGVYGNALVHTPRLDRLAGEGVRFERAFVTSPICSPSRTALVTGMYPTTTGTMHHRSQVRRGKGSGNKDFYASYDLPPSVPFLPRLFQDAGYYTVLGGPQREDDSGLGKSDYNFEWDLSAYDAADWSGRQPGQPFFAQVQLEGAKTRGNSREDYHRAFDRAAHPVSPADVTLPPYYPDLPDVRQDWAAYLSTWEATDDEVGAVLDRLEREGIADSTVVVFLTDHGVSHLRGKQFVYDEGTRVPLIVRLPDGERAGTVRRDLVEHIDLAPTVLAWAGIALPPAMQGRDLFARDLAPRPYVFAARDRGDETIDLIRSVRTERFRYVRNYYSDRPALQPNRYKDGKTIMETTRAAHAAGQLSPLQERLLFAPERPPEELYDVLADPFETENLAGDPAFRPVLDSLRAVHVRWMERSGDLGLIPEPILEVWGGRYGSKAAVWQHEDLAAVSRRARGAIAASEAGDAAALAAALGDPSEAVRYWGAYGFGRLGGTASPVRGALRAALGDPSPAVRAAAARSLALAGDAEGLDALTALLADDNVIVGLYAATFLEDVVTRADGPVPAKTHAALQAAADGRYEFLRRTARRLLDRLDAAPAGG